MRPRFANRGSRRSAGIHRPGRPRFNEAPIRESGKLDSTFSASASILCFNEAPIRESGK